MQQQEPATYTHTHNEVGNEVTDPAFSPLKRKDETDEATRMDPAPSPLPNVEPVSKGTDGNFTLDTSSPQGEYEEIQSQLDEMEGEDYSSEKFYKLLREDANSLPRTYRFLSVRAASSSVELYS
ncbi:hypothetical protein P9112_002518 [Eukaryota sp. TZLM1-RC]